MSFPAFLLRIALISVLVLNGVTSAFASVHMHLPESMPARTASVAQSTEPSTAAPKASHCAGHGEHMAATEQKIDVPVAATSSNNGDDPPVPDCCKKRCDCACVHACATAVPIAAQTSFAIPHDLSTRFMALGHPSPALPHLIRPPIG